MRRDTTEKSYRIPYKSSIRQFQKKLLKWYTNNKRNFPWRNKSTSTYKLVISEILLQRTRAETVAKFFPRFIRKYPSWKKLSKAKEEDLKGFLQPIGLWKRRASSLVSLSKEMEKRRGRFPKTRDEVESLPGVGQYIASSILLFCHEKPEPLLDTNMARVLEKYFGPRKLVDIRYDPYLQSLSRLVIPRKKAKEFNWAILDLAMLVCKIRNPDCNKCYLNENCRFYKNKQAKQEG